MSRGNLLRPGFKSVKSIFQPTTKSPRSDDLSVAQPRSYGLPPPTSPPPEEEEDRPASEEAPASPAGEERKARKPGFKTAIKSMVQLSKSPRIDDLALPQPRSYLLPPSFEQANRSLEAEPVRGEGKMEIRRSASMLEMDVIRDMLEFCEAMDAVSGEASATAASSESKSAAAGDDKHEGVGGICIDSSDRSEEEKPPLTRSYSDRRPSRGSGPSRGISKSWSSSRMNPNLLSILQQDIHPISEEGDHTQNSMPVNKTNNNDNRRSSSASTSSSRDAPLKSSFRSASSSLKSSFRSTASSQDGGDGSVNRNVSFSSLEIRTYGITLGDAPTPNGPPVSLDWHHDGEEEFDIDAYEAYRAEEVPRRKEKEMILSPMQRQYLLMNGAGYSRGAIRSVCEEARRVARQRERTARWEKTKRKLLFKSLNLS